MNDAIEASPSIFSCADELLLSRRGSDNGGTKLSVGVYGQKEIADTAEQMVHSTSIH